MIKRILAIIGIVVLVGMYLAALIAAIAGSGYSNAIFTAAIASTIAVPVIIHLFLMINNARQGKSVMDNPYSYRDKPEDEDGN
jgi:hypothetical protein